MEPIRKEVIVERWDCGLGHTHKTQESARKCFEQNANKRKNNRWTVDALGNLLIEHKEGTSRKDLAEKHNLSYARICQLVKSAEVIEKTTVESLISDDKASI